MIATIKKVAQSTTKRDMPTAFTYGTVTAVRPLKIKVEDRFEIGGEDGEEDIILMKEFRPNQSYPTHQHRGFYGSPATQATSGGSGDDSFSSHSHTLRSDYITNPGEGSEVYYGLQVGEKVVLLRNAGGQTYLVLGRM